MKIFEHITNESFFSPLTSSKYRQLNCDCMDALLKASMEKPVLYEDEAREIIDDILIDWLDDEDIKRNRSLVYDTLKSCGWIDDSAVGRDGAAVVIISDDARALMNFLHDLASGDSGIRARDVHAIYDAAKRLNTGQGRPVQDVFPEIQERIRSLCNALVSLRSNVRKTASDFVQGRPVQEILDFFRDKDVADLFENYQYIREGGFASAFFSKAKEYLDAFETDDEKMKFAAEEFAREHDVSDIMAKASIDEIIQGINRFFLVDYQKLTDDIDREINACNGAINTELILAMKFGEDNQRLLVELMNLIKGPDVAAAQEAFDAIDECVPLLSMELTCVASMEPSDVVVRKDVVTYMEESEISDEEVSLQTKLLNEKGKSRLKEAVEYVEEGLEGRKKFRPDKETVSTWSDAVLVSDLIALVGDGSEQFPYMISFTEHDVETECAVFSGIEIERRVQ